MSRVCVVGGGLAGLAAAVELADGGAEVILLEARPRLGGATFSFSRDGLSVDNGQHVFLRCCTAYQAFLRRLGVADLVSVQERMAVPVVTRGGRVHRLARTGLPAPLHLAGAVLRYPLLSRRDRARVGGTLLALRRVDPDDPAADRQSFADWLGRHGQSPEAVDALWGLISVPTLNARPEDSSLALAAMVFRTGLLDAADAADIGMARVPLSRLHAEPAAAALRRAGARIETSSKVLGVEPTGVLTRNGPVEADAVVVAVPHDVAARLVPGCERAAGLGFSPIVNLHVVYDRPVTTLPFAAGLGGRVDWVFDRTASAGLADGQYLTVSLSAAADLIGEPAAALRERFLPELAGLFPAARHAAVRRFLVTREPRATFRPFPGSGALRSGEHSRLPGVFVAGSWTDTGWPATMEGAVRSGVRAARRALSHLTDARVPEGARL